MSDSLKEFEVSFPVDGWVGTKTIRADRYEFTSFGALNFLAYPSINVAAYAPGQWASVREIKA